MLNKVVAKTYQIQSKKSNFRREMDKRHSSGHVIEGWFFIWIKVNEVRKRLIEILEIDTIIN